MAPQKERDAHRERPDLGVDQADSAINRDNTDQDIEAPDACPTRFSRYPVEPGFKGAPETGGQAARAYAPQVRGRRRQVLDALAQGPGTAEQIGERIGLHWYLVRPRLSELKVMGLTADSGARGTGALGGRVVVHRVTTPLERASFAADLRSRVQNGDKRADRLLAAIEAENGGGE
jgi:hypothetical protein